MLLLRAELFCGAPHRSGKGETPPSVSPRAKSLLAEWDDLSDPGSMRASCDGGQRVRLPVCACPLSSLIETVV